MALNYVNTGTSANKGDGDSLRLAFWKINNNLSEVVELTKNYTFTNLVVYNTASIGQVITQNIVSTGSNYFEDIYVSGTVNVGTLQGFDDINIVKDDADGLNFRLRNLNADTFTAIRLLDNQNGSLIIRHQNSTSASPAYEQGNEYIFGDSPGNTLNLGRYADLKLWANRSLYFDPTIVDEPSIKITAVDGRVTISKDLQMRGHIIPLNDSTFDLGSEFLQWRSLYVSSSTIYIGGAELAIDGGSLTVNGNPVLGGNANTGDYLFASNRMFNGNLLSSQIDNANATQSIPYTARLYIPENGDNVQPIALENRVGSVGIKAGIDANNLQFWEFGRQGTLVVPNRETVTFTAVCDSNHASGELTLSGEPWYFEVSFVVDDNGTVETQISNNTPWISNPGYTNGQVFNYSADDHGIPGYSFQLTLVDIQNPGMFMYTTNLAVNAPPEYPSTMESAGAIKISSGAKDWILGSTGDITLPNKWPIQFTAQFDQAHYVGPGPMMGDGSVSFNLELQGSGTNFQWAGDDPVYMTDRGYTSAQDFEFTEVDHGITGYVLTINMILADSGDGWVLNVNLSAGPTVADLAKIRSQDELMIRAGSKGWLLEGTQGDIYLPANGTIRDSVGNDLLSHPIPGSIAQGVYEVSIDSNGIVRYPGDITQGYQDSTQCPAGADTVIYTATGQWQHAVKLFVMVEGTPTGGTSWETQACDIIAVKGYVNDIVHVTAYGVTYSGATALATFDGQWNATTNRIEITCRPTSLTNNVVASVHAIEMTSND